MPGTNIYTIAPNTPFLPCLAQSIVNGALLPDWPRDRPFWLSDITIYVPTKRARIGLVDAFLQLGDGSQLLPDIRTLGEMDDAERAFFTDPDADSRSIMSRTCRTMILSRLVAAWARKTRPGFFSSSTLVEVLSMARSLGDLIDDFNTEEIDVSALDTLVSEELAENWQQTLALLKIAFEAWPQHLDTIGQIDASLHRRQEFDHATATLARRHANRPVIAAGSTGSVPATARFLKAISNLDKGVIVLPGLDTEMSEHALKSLVDPQNECHGHPQYGMAQLLHKLNICMPQILELGKPQGKLTCAILNAALAQPHETASWHDFIQSTVPEQTGRCFEHLTIFAAPEPNMEARAIALATRRGIAHGKTIGIITPNRDLARRIRSELQRFDIHVDDSAGTPLHQSPAGRWFRQVLAAVQSDFARIDLMSLLANRYITLGRSRSDMSRLREILDISLMRGSRRMKGLQACRQELLRKPDDDARIKTLPPNTICVEIADMLQQLEDALAPLTSCMAAGGSLSDIADCVPGVMAGLYAADEAALARFEGATELLEWAAELADDAVTMGEDGGGMEITAALCLLMQEFTVRPGHPVRQDVQIHGVLEARLLRSDMTILAGLNEGVWPDLADPGPWLSRGMKLAMSLDPPERKTGLAAHDFLMAMGADELLITYAGRHGGSPAEPSRFLQRLEALIGDDARTRLYERAEDLRQLCIAVDAPQDPVRPAVRPVPRPAADIRPRRLEVSEIEMFVRDPYAIYARHVLGLRKLPPLGAYSLDSAERGNLIHDVLRQFVEERHDFLAPDACGKLMKMARNACRNMDDSQDKLQIWLRRFSVIARCFVAFERRRDARIAARHAEKKGRVFINVAGTDIQIRGKADRIDQLDDGTLEIIDFKTGGVPQPGDMLAFLSPQLPMEAIIAAAGGFEGVAAAETRALAYLKISHGPKALDDKDFSTGKRSLTDVIDDYRRHFSIYSEKMLLDSEYAMVAHLTPRQNQHYPGTYDHLARRKEWSRYAEERE